MSLRSIILIFIAFLLSVSTGLYAKDCEDVDLQKNYEHLIDLVHADRPIQVLLYADTLINRFKKSGKINCPLYQWTHLKKSEGLVQKGEFEKGLDLCFAVIRESEKLEFWDIVADAYLSIAEIHEIINRPNDCLRNLENAIAVIKKHGLDIAYSRYAVRYASYHRIYDNLDSARVYAQIAIETGKKSQVIRSQLDGYLLAGMVALDFDEAIGYFTSSVNLYLEVNSYIGACFQRLNMAKRYFESNQFDEAMRQLDLAESHLEQSSETYQLIQEAYSSLYKRKMEFFERKGEPDSAFYYIQKYMKAEDEARYYINQEQINEKELAFAVEREQETIKYERQRFRYLSFVLILLACLLLVITFGLVYSQRKQSLITEKNSLIEEQNSKLESTLSRQSLLLSEVHHRVKNNLQLVVSLITLQAQKKRDAELVSELEDLSNKVSSIALIHELLYRSGEFDTISLEDYFGELGQHFQSLQKNGSFTFKLFTNQLDLNLETVMPLGIICSELISNSLKYTDRSDRELVIQLEVKTQDNKFQLFYQDNGPGYPEGELKRKTGSLGGMLIFSMVRQLQAQSETYNDQGAVFKMEFQEKVVSSV